MAGIRSPDGPHLFLTGPTPAERTGVGLGGDGVQHEVQIVGPEVGDHQTWGVDARAEELGDVLNSQPSTTDKGRGVPCG